MAEEHVTDVPDNADAARGDQEMDVVELGVPARTAYVSVLRTTAAALASRLDFTLDEIEDLRIAVDEASALLLTQAVPGSQLSCRFELAGDELTVSVSVHSRNPRVPARNSFAWTVLTALAGHVDTLVQPEHQRATVTLTKRGEAVAPTHPSSAQVRALDDVRNQRGRDHRPRTGEAGATTVEGNAASAGGSTGVPPRGSGAVDQ
jgi:serine/threonine-protein kinase RsbW